MNDNTAQQPSTDPSMKPFLIFSLVVGVVAILGVLILSGTSLVQAFTNFREARNPAPSQVQTQQPVWISKSMTQCNEEWDQRSVSFDKYMNSLGIEVFDRIEVPDTRSGKDLCEACTCSSGTILYLQVYKEALNDLTGFVLSAAPQK